jgi:lauroyl/myristoyl acyltransferase
VVPLARDALAVGTWRAHAVALQACINSFQYALDSATILSGNPHTVERINRSRNRFSGLHNLEAAAARGRGVFVTASLFSCFYYAMMCPWPSPNRALARLRFHLVVPRRDPLLLRIYERVIGFGERRFEFIAMESPRAGLEVLNAIRSGGVVVCMIDNVPADTAVVPVDIFGRPGCIPAGFLLIAEKYGVPIVNCTTTCRQGVFETAFDEAICCDEHFDGDALNWLASQVSATLERRVRANPGGWNSWDSLAVKWGLGRSLQTTHID